MPPVHPLATSIPLSAAEEFIVDLKSLKRAVLVGDTTEGGGHTVATRVFPFDGFRIGIRIPCGWAYNPENNQGWEGAGIIPDLAVPADRTLNAARADALGKLIEGEKDEKIAGIYRWALIDAEGRLEPMGEDLFRVGDLEYFRLGFEREGSGRIVKVSGRYDDGRTDENAREEN